jgi:hypothetical protein
VFYVELNKVDFQLVKIESFVYSDVLLNVCADANLYFTRQKTGREYTSVFVETVDGGSVI